MALNSLNTENIPAVARCTHTSWRTWDAAVIIVTRLAGRIDGSEDGESDECVEELHVEGLECAELPNSHPATYSIYTTPRRLEIQSICINASHSCGPDSLVDDAENIDEPNPVLRDGLPVHP